jgi:Transposase DDE domain
MRRALGRQVLRQRLPLATGRKHVEDCVQNLADIHLAPAAAALGWRDHRLDECPFGVRQIARIANATVIGSTTVFRLPHAAPQVCDSGTTQGITNDSFDSTTFWIGSKRWIVERTLAWISHNRRLARDFERYARSAAAFVRLAMIRIMLKRLTRSAHCS